MLKDADRTQKPLMKRTLIKLETEGSVLSNRAHLRNPTADIALDGGAIKRRPRRLKARMFLVSAVHAGLARAIGSAKEIKCVMTEKGKLNIPFGLRM